MSYSLPDTNGEELHQKIKRKSITMIPVDSGRWCITAVLAAQTGVSASIGKDDNTKDLLWNATSKSGKTVPEMQIEWLRENQEITVDKLISR